MIICDPTNLTNARTGKPNTAAILPYNPGPSALTAESNYFQAAFPLLFTAIGPASKTPNNIVTPNGQEAIILVFGRKTHAVQVSGTFTGSVIVEATLESADLTTANWMTLDTLSAAGLKQYSGIYYAIRVRISAYTSGAPLVTVQTQR